MEFYAALKALEGALGEAQAGAVIEYVRASGQESSVEMVSRIDEKIAARYAHVDKRMAETAAQIELRFAERLAGVRTELLAEIGRVREELTAEIGQVRTDLTAEIGKVRTDLTAEIGKVRTELDGKLDKVRGEVSAARKETADFRVEVAQALAAAEARILRWTVTSIVVASTFLVAVSIALRMTIS